MMIIKAKRDVMLRHSKHARNGLYPRHFDEAQCDSAFFHSSFALGGMFVFLNWGYKT